MEIQLKVNMENSIQETVNLQKFFKAHQIEGVTAKIMEKPAKKGEMTGSGLTDIITLCISSGIMATVVTSIFTVIQKYIVNKKGEIELSFQCPDNGKKFSQKFNYNSQRERDEIKSEFEKRFKSACGESTDIIIAK